MNRRIGIFILLGAGLLLFEPWACEKNYSLGPKSPPAATPIPSGPTPTPTCYAPPNGMKCASGIMWGFGQVISNTNNGIASGYAELLLAVNCSPYSTAGITLTGTGLGSPVQVPYAGGTIPMNGTTYSDYSTNNVITFTDGGTYTLTVTTTGGTSSASLVMPLKPSISSNGMTVTWPGSPQFAEVLVENSSYTQTYETSTCWSATSPAIIPASAFPVSGTYTIAGGVENYTTVISGGNGIYYAGNSDTITVMK